MKHLIIILLAMTTLTSIAQEDKASTIKNKFNRTTSIESTINAPAETVWKHLTDGSNMTNWNSTLMAFEGDIAQGEKIKLMSTLDEKRTFKLKIKEFDINKKLVWGDGKGERTYLLKDNGDGTTQFSMSETIGGLMFPMYSKYIPDFEESFEQMTSDLKKVCEQ